MTAASNGRRRTRGSLSPEAIIAAAVEFVEEHGLRGLTMSALARAMGAPVTSVHWHFRTRDNLLDALADRLAHDLYDALPPVPPHGPWDEALLAVYDALRAHLLKVPAFIELSVDRSRLLGRPAVKERINERVEANMALLVRAGFPPADAYHVLHVCSVYVRGFVVLELAAERQFETSGGREPESSYLDSELFPVTSQLDLRALSWGDADRQFRLGLDLILTGVKEMLGPR